MTQSPPPTTTVHVHQAPSNGLGTAAGICSILGIVSCGLLCPVGLILGLCSMGKEPKGLALTGVILGAIGSVGFLVVFLIFGTALFAMCGGCLGLSAAGNVIQQQVAAEPAADAVIEHYNANGQLPDDATATKLIAPFTHNGHGFRYQAGSGTTGFIIEHPGRDGQWNTYDDWQTNWDAVIDNDPWTTDEVNPSDGADDPEVSPDAGLEGTPDVSGQ